MTIDELRESAIKAANKMRDNNREIHRIMYPHADEQKLWDESTDKANVMAKYILAGDTRMSQLWSEVSQWLQLAKAQREWFREHHEDGTNAAVCPTDAGIEAGERLLGRVPEART